MRMKLFSRMERLVCVCLQPNFSYINPTATDKNPNPHMWALDPAISDLYEPTSDLCEPNKIKEKKKMFYDNVQMMVT